MYLIKEIWVDTMENGRASALGYKNIGFVKTEEEARQIVKDGGALRADRFKWPLIWGDEPRFKYEKVRFMTPLTKSRGCVSYWDGFKGATSYYEGDQDRRCLAKMNCPYTKRETHLCPALNGHMER